MPHLSRLSLIQRLSFFQVLFITVTIGATSFLLSGLITHRIELRTEENLKQQVTLVVQSIAAYNAQLVESANTLNRVFQSSLSGPLSLQSEPGGVPQLRAGSLVLNGNTELADRFFNTTQATGSIFVRNGAEFVRIATSVKNEQGQRMTDSTLEHSSPAYEHLIQGEPFTGKSQIAGRSYMASYVPLRNSQGEVIAVSAVAVDFTASLKSLSENILHVRIGKSGYIYALDAAPGPELGTLRIHPAQAGKSILASKDAHGFEFIRDILQRKEGITHYEWINTALGETKARTKVVAFSYVPDWQWVVGAGSYLDELNTEGVYLRNAMLMATVLMVLVLVVLFVAMARRWISGPLQRMVHITEVLASGDFRQISEARIEERETQNEVEQLELGMLRMARSLCALLEKVHNAANQVASASQQIAESARQASQTSEQQSEKTVEVADAMRGMSAAVSEVCESSGQAADAAHTAAETARAGGHVVQETLGTMQAIAGSTQQVASRITELGESSNRIGAIASVISEIAEQTNLLALNAAIEAARAGEQGRGFAVVAGEVRRLAERTASATTEISSMITSIQNGARAAVEAMQHENEAVTQGVARTQGSGEALHQIIEMAGSVGSMVTQIASSANRQSAAAEAVHEHVGQIAEMSRQSSTNAAETARSCSELTRLAASLQEVVGHFRF